MRLEELSLAEIVAVVGGFNPRTGAEMQPGMFSDGSIYLAEAAAAFIELSDLGGLTIKKVFESEVVKGAETAQLFATSRAPSHPVLSYSYDLISSQSVARTARWYLMKFSNRQIHDRLETAGLVNVRGRIIRRASLSDDGLRLYGEARAELDNFVAPGSPILAEDVSERTKILGSVLRAGQVWKQVFPEESPARMIEIWDRLKELHEHVISEGEGARRRSQLLSELSVANAGFVT